jgi:hypothetical protein
MAMHDDLLKCSNLINKQIYFMNGAFHGSLKDKIVVLENIKNHIDCQLEHFNNLINRFESFDEFEDAINNAGIHATAEEFESIIKRAPKPWDTPQEDFLQYAKDYLNVLKQKEDV